MINAVSPDGLRERIIWNKCWILILTTYQNNICVKNSPYVFLNSFAATDIEQDFGPLEIVFLLLLAYIILNEMQVKQNE